MHRSETPYTTEESILITPLPLIRRLNERHTEEDRNEIELYSGCITVIPWFNGCLVWNKAALSPTEAAPLWRDEVCPLANPRLDEIGVQK